MLSEEIKSLIQLYQHEDADKVAFKKFPQSVDVPFFLQQLSGRKHIAQKVPAWTNCLNDLVFPPHLSFEQASSEITARYKASLVAVDTLLDGTGGLGVDSYFFAHRAKSVSYLEQQASLCHVAKHNFAALGVSNITVTESTVEKYIATMFPVDCIYLDPARRSDRGRKVVALEDCTPNVLEIIDTLKQKAKIILIKISPMFDVKLAIRSLPDIQAVHIVAVNNECKELLLLIQESVEPERRIYCVNLQSNKENQTLSFTQEQDNDLSIIFTSEIKHYLYEPNVAILKGGYFGTLVTQFSLEKLHPNSHLFTSEGLMVDFPGRIFEVISVIPFHNQSLKKALKGVEKANITVRNFPLTVADIRKKIKLKEGGDVYLFATTLANQEKVCVLCKKPTN